MVYCTENFLNIIQGLESNNSYKALWNDVCDFLIDKSISELHMMKDILNQSPGKYSLNKYRIKNSMTNKGKSSCYRCISVCLPEKESIYLDTIYPKTGSHGKENLDKEGYKKIARNIMDSIKGNNLFVIDIINRTYKKVE